MASFPSIRIEGGLLGPDVLDRVVAGDLPGQKPADFGLEARRTLTDEIAAVHTDARAVWTVFQHRLDRLKPDDLATTATRDSWVIPFFALLGYEARYNPRAFEADGLSFAISHRANEAEDSPPLHIVGVRQDLGRVPASGRPRLAPHSLLQEFLNRTEHVWGVVTNGATVRLLRDCNFIRRQAYIEFDLQAMFEEQRFPDFAVFYRLLHRSRLPQGTADAGECLLERYYTHSIEQGGRIRDHLRDGVEACIVELANGFLRHSANDDLRRQVLPGSDDGGRLTGDDLYRQLLRLVYRFLFLLVSEDRGLLSAEPIYRDHYGIGRLRRLLDRRAAFTDHDDLWQSLRVLWRVLTRDEGCPSLGGKSMAGALGLPVLNGELFSHQLLDDCAIANRDLLGALWHLTWYRENNSAPPRRVNYAALDVEELGSVYESLLEFHPTVEVDSRGRPEFSLLLGSERKTTGSYYTPPELVGELIKSALEPVLANRLQQQPKTPEKAILSIRVCDPACGSGHFLLAAARRMGRELARVRSGADEPAPEDVRRAVRDVVSHCIYGVDRNPLAVDLCRVALWLESHTTDKPLTFLDHRIRLGDSLVGVFDLEVLTDGIPDEAFKPLEGDDKPTARELSKRNKEEKRGQGTMFDKAPDLDLRELVRQSRAVDDIADDTPEAIRRKKLLFEQSHSDRAWVRQKEACDLWAAAFFQPLVPGQPAITSGVLNDHLSDRRTVPPQVAGLAMALSHRQRFFHWPLEFPEVFAAGGFDVFLSNPPWEHVELKEQEFFAARDATVALAKTKAERTRLIKKLEETDPSLHAEYRDALWGFNAMRKFLASSTRYPLTGRGRINTYAVFAELAAVVGNPRSRAGVILPTGIATDDGTKDYFGSLVNSGRLADLIGFENEDFIFPAVHHSFKFCKTTLAGSADPVSQTRIGFYIRKFAQLAEEDRFFTLSKDEFWLLNPNTGNCPIFRSQADAELNKAIYRRVPVLWREATDDGPEDNPWKLRFMQGLFNMSSDSGLFKTAAELRTAGGRLKGNVFVGQGGRYLPLYEAKMLHQFDHRYSTYEGATQSQLNVGILPQPTPEQKGDPSYVVQPRYWVHEEEVNAVVPKYPEPLAEAVKLGHRQSIQYVLAVWAAGYYLNRRQAPAAKLLQAAAGHDLEAPVAKVFLSAKAEERAAELERDYPLTEEDVQAIGTHQNAPETLAQELIERFSPKWFLGWRDIARSTDRRTIIAGACPIAAVGGKFPLVFSKLPGVEKLALLGCLDSFVADYCARQKVGGTSVSMFLLRQFPVVTIEMIKRSVGPEKGVPLASWLTSRVLELVYTGRDLEPLARDCGYDGLPFPWDEDRRFALRCELDAAFFHLYLPAEASGEWRPASGETPEQLAAVRKHFPRPRDAVAYILDQFPIVRDKDEKAHGNYRTKDQILANYDAMLRAMR